MFYRFGLSWLILGLVSTRRSAKGNFVPSHSTATSLSHRIAFVRSCPATKPSTSTGTGTGATAFGLSPVFSPFPLAPNTLYSDITGSTCIWAKTKGWADENGGTTGGEKKGKKTKTKTVSTTNAFLDAIGKQERLVIRVKGNKINLNGKGDRGMVPVKSDKTIIGVSNNQATITGGGLDINGVSNVIVRNILFTGIKSKKADAINIVKSKNVWIDHCDFTKTKDGMVDVKKGSDFVTISWNHFIGPHDKTSLVGHEDENREQDKDHLRVTYHHNWFERTTERHPRVRFSKLCHVYNNFYDNLKKKGYGVASTMDAKVLVERNYFEGVKRPTVVGHGTSGPGILQESKNHFTPDCGECETNGTVNISPPYDYKPPLPADDVKGKVRGGAGRGLN